VLPSYRLRLQWSTALTASSSSPLTSLAEPEPLDHRFAQTATYRQALHERARWWGVRKRATSGLRLALVVELPSAERQLVCLPTIVSVSALELPGVPGPSSGGSPERWPTTGSLSNRPFREEETASRRKLREQTMFEQYNSAPASTSCSVIACEEKCW
jgi:hypothetical protein